MQLPPSATGQAPQEILRRLELLVARRLDGMLHGDHLGLVPGQGSELGEARPYLPGDDVRRIDWNVTARSQVPHVRDTIADRELETWLVVDQSASLRFGTAACTKHDLAVAGAAAVGFLTARMGNRVGALFLDGRKNPIQPARQGRIHLLGILRQAVEGGPDEGGGPTDLGAGMRRLSAVARRRGMVVLISDFLSPAGWDGPLRSLSERHDVLAIEVVDPREMSLPRVGMLRVVDPETGALREVQTNSKRVRQQYEEAAAGQREAIAASLRGAGVDHLQLRTDRDWLLDVIRFVSSRRDRIDHKRRANR